MTGLDPEVKSAVLTTNGVREAIQRAFCKVERGANTILFYCHAGHHRSVVAAEELHRLLVLADYLDCQVEHRDLERH